MSSGSSWHPALMPNSTTDIISSRPANTQQEAAPAQTRLLVEKPHTSSITSMPKDEDSVVTADDEAEQDVNGGLLEDDTAHPKLTDVRDTLTTSSVSPGSAELDELDKNPHQIGVQRHGYEEEKANSQSDETLPSNKHLSTMSFARTVSHEVNWGEEDDVDPEWNIQRTDTDPFKLMGKTDRTNSFPQVPPAHSVPTNYAPLHTQAEEILNEVEKESEGLLRDEDKDGKAALFVQESSQSDQSANFSIMSNGNPDTVALNVTEYAPAYGGDIPEDKESRYEEGLPLISSADNCDIAFSTNQSIFLDNTALGEEDDFFTQITKNDLRDVGTFAEPPHLERNSTKQVMDSLDLRPRQQNQEEIAEETNVGTSQSSLDVSTGGGIAVSTSTVLSEVFGTPEATQLDQLSALETDSDLAAKWKAALAGDDFLDDDDELLKDDEPTAMDPAALFGSDDEGFLEDTDDPKSSSNLFSQISSPPIPTPIIASNGHMVGFDALTGTAHSNRPSSSGSRYLPSGPAAAAASHSGQYAPSGAHLTDLSRSTTTSFMAPYTSPTIGNYSAQHQQQRPELPKAQSFANKSKGGYASPYDLPMEVVRPRKRPSTQHLSHSYNTSATPATVPPPRNNILGPQPPPPSRGSASSLSPPSSSHSLPPSQIQSSPALGSINPPKTVRKSTSGFFEDLPISSRPKPTPRPASSLSTSVNGQYSPQFSPHPQFSGPSAPAPFTPPVPQQSFQPPPGQGLIAPERVSPFAPLPTPNTAVPVRPASTKYSPAPAPQQTLNTASSQMTPRYSPAPQISRPSINSTVSAPGNSAPPSILAHQPRTSSPLAHFERSQDQMLYGSQVEGAGFDRRSSSSGYDPTLRTNHLPPTREVDENDVYPGISPISHTPPPPQAPTSRVGVSPSKRTASNYLPQTLASSPPSFKPPPRSQTQSPGTLHGRPKLEMATSPTYQRPASVELPSSPPVSNGSNISRPRGFSQGLNYIAPVDGRENDPMQRWRGAPVFAWGVGGTIVTSFPTDVPRYGKNLTTPMILRSPGVVKIRNIKDTDPLQERLATFPGPLKGKSKKKDVISWLTSGIETLENSTSYLRSLSRLSHEVKRTEERILLWKILRVFIENDGTLEGTAAVEKAVRAVLSPGIDDDTTGTTPLYATGADLTGISQSSSTTTRADPVDPAAVDQLRKYLLRGEREKAVWEAVDKRLWAHAMLISNTVSKDLYKQVAQEFVQKEVKIIGDNTESLAALYEIFAGNFEESVDELVPPSARAGFQMVSTSNASGPSKDALDGLDRWRETLGLVLSNRSTDDSQALNALGKLLAGYGRAEAAHICFLFARSYSIFGGIDDPQTSIVLVGSDHLRQPYEFDKELEPILLSEVFEYGMSLSSTAKTLSASPHLSVYKLQHATILAEYGYREKALQYCEAIASSITSQTRRSPYHHALFASALDDLSKRLKQSPKDGSSSWISKPSIDKVSGSVWSTFNKFVAGDEHEAAGQSSSTGSTHDVGPFARIAGGTPTISRSPSNSDLYGSYNGAININGAMAGTKAGSRYAPGRAYSPATHDSQLATSFGSQSRSSFEGRSSGEHRGQYESIRQNSDHRPDSQPTNNFTPQAPSSYTPQQSYAPYSNDSLYTETSSPYTPDHSTHLTEQVSNTLYPSPQIGSNFETQQPPSSYTPSGAPYTPQSSEYEPPTSVGYAPPTYSGYEPPSYQPSNMDEEPDSPISTRPKKKSFMDDDEDDVPTYKAKNSGEKTKAEKDSETDEAFRKAAEADAAKAGADQPAKKGWGLGGWFGGAKKEPDMNQPNKPIRAKLGEASSFVYDPDLKRWVNKKGGAENSPTSSATPPPPRASGPPRSVSGPPGGPASESYTSSPHLGGPPQRAVSKSSSVGDDSPEIGSSVPPPLGSGGLGAPPLMNRSASNGSTGPATGPPSRPGTGMSNASSIDDLLGPPTAGVRKAVGKKAKKGRGYVDVMGDKAAGS